MNNHETPQITRTESDKSKAKDKTPFYKKATVTMASLALAAGMLAGCSNTEAQPEPTLIETTQTPEPAPSETKDQEQSERLEEARQNWVIDLEDFNDWEDKSVLDKDRIGNEFFKANNVSIEPLKLKDASREEIIEISFNQINLIAELYLDRSNPEFRDTAKKLVEIIIPDYGDKDSKNARSELKTALMYLDDLTGYSTKGCGKNDTGIEKEECNLLRQMPKFDKILTSTEKKNLIDSDSNSFLGFVAITATKDPLEANDLEKFYKNYALLNTFGFKYDEVLEKWTIGSFITGDLATVNPSLFNGIAKVKDIPEVKTFLEQ